MVRLDRFPGGVVRGCYCSGFRAALLTLSLPFCSLIVGHNFWEGNMKFVTVRDFRLRPGSVWKDLKTEDVIITSKGKPLAAPPGTSDVSFDETVAAIRRSKAEFAVSRMRKSAAKRG